jgi:hypothetical protein
MVDSGDNLASLWIGIWTIATKFEFRLRHCTRLFEKGEDDVCGILHYHTNTGIGRNQRIISDW